MLLYLLSKSPRDSCENESPPARSVPRPLPQSSRPLVSTRAGARMCSALSGAGLAGRWWEGGQDGGPALPGPPGRWSSGEDEGPGAGAGPAPGLEGVLSPLPSPAQAARLSQCSKAPRGVVTGPATSWALATPPFQPIEPSLLARGAFISLGFLFCVGPCLRRREEGHIGLVCVSHR